MADTTFVDQVTPIPAAWLNDVDYGIYKGPLNQLPVGQGVGTRLLWTNAVSGLTIDNSAIGNTTPSTGKFTNVTVTPSAGTAVTVNGAAATQLVSIQFTQSGQSSWQLYQPASSSDFRIFGNAADRFIITNAGNVTVPAPSSGTAVSATGASTGNVFNATTVGTGGTALNVNIPAATAGNAFQITQSGQTSWTINVAVSSNDLRVSPSAANSFFTYNIDNGGTYYEVGTRSLPFNSQSGSTYTLVATDRGKLINLTFGGAVTVTIPGGVFNSGDTVTLLSNTAVANASVVPAGSLTSGLISVLRNGTQTLTKSGMCTLVFTSSTQAYITGAIT